MLTEALSAGHWKNAGGIEYPKVQILKVGDLLARKVRPRMPQQDKRSLTGYKASRQSRKGEQAPLDPG